MNSLSLHRTFNLEIFNMPSNQSKRQHERRTKERRAEDYPFGSQEWLDRIKQENLLWPKYDRRRSDRRKAERRQVDMDTPSAFKKPKINVLRFQNILTDEEKQMLNDLIQKDRSN